MTDVVQECEKKYGKQIQITLKSTYNPKTKKYFALSDSFVPDPINYRLDLWGEIGMTPNTWDDIRKGGKKIKDKTNIPVGIGLSNELDTAMAVRAILYSFGGSVQDENNRLALNSKNTLEAVKFVKALYQETMPDVAHVWAPATRGRPEKKYSVLADSLDWATNVGFPGYATAAVDETFQTWALNTMFAQAAVGQQSPEDAIKEAEGKCKRIWARWQERKLI